MANANTPNPQPECRFVTTLPREMRDLIYLELWRHTGLRQHILWHWHDERAKSHFSRFPCTTEFTFHDPLQAEIEAERARQSIPLGQQFRHKTYAWRLQSPWNSHWACGEAAARVNGLDAIRQSSTAAGCPKGKPIRVGDSDYNSDFTYKDRLLSESMSCNPSATDPSAYLPMLMSCKLISSECLESIYESTTFVFTDMVALQFFLGPCSMPSWAGASGIKLPTPPPGFFLYATQLELSLDACFSYESYCSTDSRLTDPSAPGLDSQVDVAFWRELYREQEKSQSSELHKAYDFHWLRLGKFQKLRSLKIWITARGTHMPDAVKLLATPDLYPAEVKDIMSYLGRYEKVQSVDISMPLAKNIKPCEEDGFVELEWPSDHDNAGAVKPVNKVRLWKRGTGDKFHPRPLSFFWQLTGHDYVMAREKGEVQVRRKHSFFMFYSPPRTEGEGVETLLWSEFRARPAALG